MLTQIFSFAAIGLRCGKITVEVGSTPGEAKFFIVGLGDTAVQESKQRVAHALRQSGYRFPTGRVITVNLAPADLRKAGPRYDLPIALGLLVAHDLADIPHFRLADIAFIGELALDGSLRHVTGILPAALACKRAGFSTLVVPFVDGPEAALVPGLTVIAPRSLHELVEILKGDLEPEPIAPPSYAPDTRTSGIDFADVRGQEQAKRALEIAAAGGHNVLLSGAPGSGKTLLARAFRDILPELSHDERMEVTQIYSIANLLPEGIPLVRKRPFRVIHHTASGVSIVGGGQIPGPGEISLAHRGVLFMDELAEFPAHVLEVLRQPLEDREITITRAHGTVTYPADFTLVAAMNPSRYGGGRKGDKRISAPFLDRIDLTVDVRRVPMEDLERAPGAQSEKSVVIAQRVAQARERQRKRFTNRGIRCNAEMSVKHIDDLCPLDAASRKLLRQAADRMNLSARGYHRTIKIARTIADLQGQQEILMEHIAESLQYRQMIDDE